MKNNIKDLIILGASGFGREIAWLIERINHEKKEWNIIGYTDIDENKKNTFINGYKVLGDDTILKDYPNAFVICGTANPQLRKKIVDNIYSINSEQKFATLIDPSVIISDKVKVGKDCVICANTIITVNIEIFDHVIININCTIGHDSKIKEYCTLYPNVNISGNVLIDDACEIGTGTKIIQGINISKEAIIGAGSVVIRNTESNSLYVGVPAKRIK